MCTVSVKHYSSSEVPLVSQCVGVFVTPSHIFTPQQSILTVIILEYNIALTLTELRYMRTSSNSLKRKKQDAMHCLPGIVSESKKYVTHTSSHSFPL